MKRNFSQVDFSNHSSESITREPLARSRRHLANFTGKVYVHFTEAFLAQKNVFYRFENRATSRSKRFDVTFGQRDSRAAESGKIENAKHESSYDTQEKFRDGHTFNLLIFTRSYTSVLVELYEK